MRLRLIGWILGIGLTGCATHAMTQLEGASTVGAPVASDAASTAPTASSISTDSGAP